MSQLSLLVISENGNRIFSVSNGNINIINYNGNVIPYPHPLVRANATNEEINDSYRYNYRKIPKDLIINTLMNNVNFTSHADISFDMGEELTDDDINEFFRRKN